MATVPRKGEFYDTESGSGEWAGDEQVGDGTTREQRIAAARAPGYDDSDKRQAQAANAPSRMPARPGQSKPKAKAPIVTKEELAKSGLSLRDYMNKQKGLTRRDGSAPAKAPSKAESAESAKSNFLTSLDREAENRKNYVPRATPGARAPKQTTSKPAAKKPYMPEQPDMSYRKGGKINGIAKRGLTKCKIV